MRKIVRSLTTKLRQIRVHNRKKTSKRIERNASTTIEQNMSKKIKAETSKYFLTCIDNLLEESRQMDTPIEDGITRNQITGTKHLSQILLTTTETGGDVK